MIFNSARYNYSISYERAKISKRRDKFSFIFPFAVTAVFIVLSIFYKEYFLKYLPYFTEDKVSIWYPAALFIITSALAVPIARIIFPEKYWPDILLTYNHEAVAAAAEAGIELILPQKPAPKPSPLTEEEFIKIKAEVANLKEKLEILNWALYFSLKIITLFILLDYFMKFVISLADDILTVFVLLGGIIILFAAPMTILYLIRRWAKLDGTEE